MRINNNMSAVITNNKLLGTESSLSDVMEKLSSGFNINHASDSPSGIAIAGKMQAQIDGLGQASTNGSDGISVLQTAEGALNEVTEMIQRMRELSVQAANGTNSAEEREAIQREIDSLLEEIDRIASTTEFNRINLLNGSLDARTYAEHATRLQTSNTVPAGIYQLEITAAATQGTVTAAAAMPDNVQGTGIIFINGHGVEITGGTRDSIYEQLRKACETGGAIISDPYDATGNAQPITISSMKYGAKADLKVEFDSAEFAAVLGFTDAAAFTETDIDGNPLPVIKTVGEDAKVTLHRQGDADVKSASNPTGTITSLFGSQSTISMDGNHMTVSDTKGFSLSFLAEEGYTGNISFNVTDIGTMALQVGANEGQQMKVRIAAVTTEFMYIDDVNVMRVQGPEDAMDALEDALSYVTAVRSQLGAYENRLEHTTKSLDATEENMTSAISRIEDADMATTMVEYTKLNVLEQAGVSALAQANELPQLALQLLQ
ncbi:MAG: flagellin [Pseudobutyrivibrio sp.]|nr:flagellin [Pseudobutyrivibrio sp.]